MTAIELFIASMNPGQRVLIIGPTQPEVAAMTQAGIMVDTVSWAWDGALWPDTPPPSTGYDGIYCAHTLEHMRNVGSALDAMRTYLWVGGLLCIVVPPAKHNIVGGHLSIWNAGLLLYNLIRAHFDCSQAAVRSYDYNVAVLVRYTWATYAEASLNHDNGDLERLQRFFPLPMPQDADGRLDQHNWRPLIRNGE